MKSSIRTTTVKKYTVTLDNESVIECLRSKGHDLPDSARVTVRVPGGGDWSNTSLEIGNDSDIFVTWEVRTES